MNHLACAQANVPSYTCSLTANPGPRSRRLNVHNTRMGVYEIADFDPEVACYLSK